MSLRWDGTLRTVVWAGQELLSSLQIAAPAPDQAESFPRDTIPTLTRVKYAYVCVHGAICGAACACEYTCVSAG